MDMRVRPDVFVTQYSSNVTKIRAGKYGNIRRTTKMKIITLKNFKAGRGVNFEAGKELSGEQEMIALEGLKELVDLGLVMVIEDQLEPSEAPSEAVVEEQPQPKKKKK
jgi:hypothetical protein